MVSLLSLESSPLSLEGSDTSNCAYCKLVIGNILKKSNGNKCDQCNVMIHPNFTAYHKCGYPNCPICKNPITNSQYWRHIRSHPGHENDSPPPPRKTFENREYRGRYGSSSSSSNNNNNNNNNITLICFCENERKCHRSIVKEMVLDYYLRQQP
jgi:uncharacterized protein DUF488